MSLVTLDNDPTKYALLCNGVGCTSQFYAQGNPWLVSLRAKARGWQVGGPWWWVGQGADQRSLCPLCLPKKEKRKRK